VPDLQGHGGPGQGHTAVQWNTGIFTLILTAMELKEPFFLDR
jgi:hypothetical protein